MIWTESINLDSSTRTEKDVAHGSDTLQQSRNGDLSRGLSLVFNSSENASNLGCSEF